MISDCATWIKGLAANGQKWGVNGRKWRPGRLYLIGGTGKSRCLLDVPRRVGEAAGPLSGRLKGPGVYSLQK